jgi:putative inorganic carbon (hco3(-)) transporter
MGLRDIILLVLGYACVPLAAWNAYWGLMGYCWLSYMRPQSLVWSEDVQSARMVFFVGIALVVRSIFTTGPRVRLTAITVVFIALWAWLGLATLCSRHVDSSQEAFLLFSKAAVAVVLITGLVRGRQQYRWLFILLAACPGIWALKYGLFFITSGGGTSTQGVGGLDNNDMALFISMALPLLVFGACEVRRKWVRRGMYGVAVLVAPAVMVTTSRGGLLALAAAIGITLARKTRWWKALIGLGLVGAIGLAIVPAAAMKRYETIGAYQEDSSAMGRINAWKTAVAMANDRPLTGVGPSTETFLAEYDNYKQVPEDKPHVAHSIWFSMLGEAGYVGLAIYVLLTVLAILSTRRVMAIARRRGPTMNWAWSYAAGLQAAIITFAIGGSFLSQNRFEYIYAIFTMTVPLQHLAELEEKHSAGSIDERASLTRKDNRAGKRAQFGAS